jgi:aminoglycoside phosphotransferase (APT) family kinase protein
MLPTVVRDTDRTTLIDALAKEGWPVDLAGAQVDETGWENVVLATSDGWIFRFPRSAQVPFGREISLLRLLQGRLPVSIPDVVRIGTQVRVAKYRRLAGASFSPAAYLAAPARLRNRLAASLADFLVAMHTALTESELAALDVPAVDHAYIHEFVTSRMHLLLPEHRPIVAGLAESYAETWVAAAVQGPRVLLHNDFHHLNMVFSAPIGDLVGIWDFSCAALEVPTFELRYLGRCPRDLMVRLADAYTTRTGWPVDLHAAIQALRMEDVYDALCTGHLELFHAALQRWAVFDSGEC